MTEEELRLQKKLFQGEERRRKAWILGTGEWYFLENQKEKPTAFQNNK